MRFTFFEEQENACLASQEEISKFMLVSLT